MTGSLYFLENMGAGGALLDFDRDGDLDLYAVQGALLGTNDYSRALMPPNDRPPRDRLYRNELMETGSLRFVDVTDEAGLLATGYGMGVAIGDYDHDGWPDIYVTNWGSNQLLKNNGDGTFVDVTEMSGTDDPRWSTSAAFFDYDGDGFLDLAVTNYVRYSIEADIECISDLGRRDYCWPLSYAPEPDRLFRNRGDGTFEEVTLQTGLAAAFGRGLGVIATDFNRDGWQDVYIANDGDPKHGSHLHRPFVSIQRTARFCTILP